VLVGVSDRETFRGSGGQQIIVSGYERQRRQLVVYERFIDGQRTGKVDRIIAAQFAATGKLNGRLVAQ